MRSVWCALFLAAVVLTAAPPAHAQFQSIEDFAKHSPNSRIKLDYAIWDHFLDQYVFYNGFSDRRPAKRRETSTGSRVQYGHRGRYANEGNRVAFSLMEVGIPGSLTAYREDLERISGEIDFSKLSRNEQLAFWFNFHNVALVEKLAHRYPLATLGGLQKEIFETKDLTVAGVKLSLNDIRLRIVYRNWPDMPYVMYGLWHGTLGGPSIQPYAFTGENVSRGLALTGTEFVNSLRGVDFIRGRTLRASRVYDEARPYFFGDWPTDIVAHLALFAQKDVNSLLSQTRRVSANVYDWSIADLVRGQTSEMIRDLIIARSDGTVRIQGIDRLPSHGLDFVKRSIERQQRMTQERQGRVTIIDLEPRDTEENERDGDADGNGEE